MRFLHPEILWALTLLLPLAAYYVWRSLKGGATIDISTVKGVLRAPRSVRYYMRHIPFVLRCTALALIIVALARPQIVDERDDTSVTDAEGIDIVMAVDISTSMLARDFTPDRISAAKEVAADFIADRKTDRIGIVAFAGESFTLSPLTTDKETLKTLLGRLRSGVIEDGTAIGNGLATSINRLRESDAESKVVILLTDGVNNRGEISPLMAAQIAGEYGIKVYTIGVGKQGKAPYPVTDMFGNVMEMMVDVEIDEEVLGKIASETGGRYFRATDNNSLRKIYDEIDRLEKSKVDIVSHNYVITHEKCLAWILGALLALALEFLIRTLVLNKLP